jgi:SAM-dependent methyltransferase
MNQPGPSYLTSHQRLYPERWHHFYETQGLLLREISGLGQQQGRIIVDMLWNQAGLYPGCSTIDLGCGTGWIALPLASKGARVLAVDNSAAMLETLRQESRAFNLTTLETRHACWTTIACRQPFDLALAACFPPALSPDGIARMERLGKTCAFLLPSGGQGLPWIRNLWKTICNRDPFSEPSRLQVALNYLMSAGKKPRLLPIKTPLVVDLPLEQVLDFYIGYFSLFEKTSSEITAVIQKELEPFTHAGRVQTRMESCSEVIWWAS